LQRLGVRRIIAKAGNELHGSILRRLGVSRVVTRSTRLGCASHTASRRRVYSTTWMLRPATASPACPCRNH
jgi:hypothetical protein